MPSKQELLRKLYEMDNVVTVTVTLPPDQWTKLRQASPKFGFKKRLMKAEAGATTDPDELAKMLDEGRYEWFTATSVTIEGTRFPATPLTFADVGIIKKSFAGSFDNDKPSLRLDFTKFNKDKAQEKALEDGMGLKSLTLNNSKQDTSFVRQTIGYEIYRQAGLPYPRCNYAKVVVNGTDYGAFINLEPMKKAFLQRNFGGNDKGNLYEMEFEEDIVEEKIVPKIKGQIIPKLGITFEGGSEHENLADLLQAAAHLRLGSFAAASQVVDMDNFMRYHALEILLKSWDSYAILRNNTYLYNDVVAVEEPDVAAGHVRIKFIPYGIDMILQEDRAFVGGTNGRVAAIVHGDKAAAAKLRDTIRMLAETVFSPANLAASILPLVEKAEDMVNRAAKRSDAPSVSREVEIVRRQLRRVRSGAYQLLGTLPPLGKGAVVFLSETLPTGEVHALTSASHCPADLAGGHNRKIHVPVYHSSLKSDSPNQEWLVTTATTNTMESSSPPYKITTRNKANDAFLHCDTDTDVDANGTKGGAKPILSTIRNQKKETPDKGSEFFLLQPITATGPHHPLPKYEGEEDWWTATGFYTLQHVGTGRFVCLSVGEKGSGISGSEVQGGLMGMELGLVEMVADRGMATGFSLWNV